MSQEVIRAQAHGWRTVAKALDEHMPDWRSFIGDPGQNAANAIGILAGAGKAPANTMRANPLSYGWPQVPAPCQCQDFGTLNIDSAHRERQDEANRRMQALADVMAEQGRPTTATGFLDAARKNQEERAAEYDSPQGERSMASTVAAFNAITGHELTEAEGWLFMETLKNVRLFSANGFHYDSAMDGVSYASLKAEAKAGEAR